MLQASLAEGARTLTSFRSPLHSAAVFAGRDRLVRAVHRILETSPDRPGATELYPLHDSLAVLRRLQAGAYAVGAAAQMEQAVHNISTTLRQHPNLWESRIEDGSFSARVFSGSLAQAIEEGQQEIPDIDDVLKKLSTFVTTILTKHDDVIDPSEASHDQIRALLNLDEETDVSEVTVKDILYYLVTEVSHDPKEIAAHVTSALVDKDGNFMYLSGNSALHMAESLGSTLFEGRISPSDFKESLQEYLESVPVAEPMYLSARPIAADAVDNFTQSNFRNVRVDHVDMDLEFDFDAQQIRGEAIYRIAHQKENRLILDTKSLEVEVVYIRRIGSPDWEKAPFSLGEEKEYLGQALEIDLGGPAAAVKVVYKTSTTDRASGLQWLPPEQTSSGNKPFLFTQGQYSHNRGWVPLQDTSMAKMTMTSRLRVKSDLDVRAVMVSDQEHGGNVPTSIAEDGWDVWQYKIDQPVAPYLLAIAIGELDAHVLSDRSILYAEPAIMEKSKSDYEIYEQILQVLEDILGPLPSRVLDTVIMPPSFPWGGMENLGLNMNSNTIITGDKSQMAVAIHEAVHAWFGNLITNATLGDFWLNEGFTMWVQRLAMRRIFGEEAEVLDVIVANKALDAQMLSRIENGHATALGVRFQFDDPDEAANAIPYDKGYLFLEWLSRKVGENVFIAFLQHYLSDFRFLALTTEDFRKYLENYFELEEVGISHQDLDRWLYGPGLPNDAPEFASERYNQIKVTTQSWLQSHSNLEPAPQMEEWGFMEWALFIEQFINADEVPVRILHRLRTTHKLDETKDPEIASNWFRLVAQRCYRESYPAMANFLDGRVGRLKYLRYLFIQLMQSGEEEWAREVYKQMKPKLHRISQGILEKILKI